MVHVARSFTHSSTSDWLPWRIDRRGLLRRRWLSYGQSEWWITTRAVGGGCSPSIHSCPGAVGLPELPQLLPPLCENDLPQESVLVEPREAVDDDGDGQGEDEDAEEGAESARDLSQHCGRVEVVSHRGQGHECEPE